MYMSSYVTDGNNELDTPIANISDAGNSNRIWVVKR